MKKSIALILIIALLTTGKSSQAQQKAKWNELEAFHEIMSKTFHPAEEGKLEPIKNHSKELVEKAVAWKNSTAPAGYDKAAVKKSLKRLVEGAKELDKMVKAKSTDASIKEKLSGLHDTFHEIMEKCEKEDHIERVKEPE